MHEVDHTTAVANMRPEPITKPGGRLGPGLLLTIAVIILTDAQIACFEDKIMPTITDSNTGSG